MSGIEDGTSNEVSQQSTEVQVAPAAEVPSAFAEDAPTSPPAERVEVHAPTEAAPLPNVPPPTQETAEEDELTPAVSPTIPTESATAAFLESIADTTGPEGTSIESQVVEQKASLHQQAAAGRAAALGELSPEIANRNEVGTGQTLGETEEEKRILAMMMEDDDFYAGFLPTASTPAIPVSKDLYLKQNLRIFRFTSQLVGTEPIDKELLTRGDKPMPESLRQLFHIPPHGKSIVVDIAELRAALGLFPLAFAGNVFMRLQTAAKSQSPLVLYTPQNRPKTGNAICYYNDEMVEQQNIYFTITWGMNKSTDRLPNYAITVPTGLGEPTEKHPLGEPLPPFYCPVAIWAYRRDGRFMIEADRNFGPTYDQAPTENNFGELVGYVLDTLLKSNYPLVGSTITMFDTLESHREYRQNIRRQIRQNSGSRGLAAMGGNATAIQNAATMGNIATAPNVARPGNILDAFTSNQNLA